MPSNPFFLFLAFPLALPRARKSEPAPEPVPIVTPSRRDASDEAPAVLRRRLTSLSTACAKIPSLVRRRSNGSERSRASAEAELGEEEGATGHPLRKSWSFTSSGASTPARVIWESDAALAQHTPKRRNRNSMEPAPRSAPHSPGMLSLVEETFRSTGTVVRIDALPEEELPIPSTPKGEVIMTCVIS